MFFRPVPYGLNIPPGARIVKRLVPVPVGPRIPQNQMRMGQPGHRLPNPPGNIPPHMVDPSRVPPEMVKNSEKRRGGGSGGGGGNDAESPIMPLTEDEFYLWQQQYKKR